MPALIILGFLAAGGIVAWAIFEVCFIASDITRLTRYAFCAFTIAVIIATGWSTFNYSYFIDENMRVDGWPVPVIVFQRKAPGEPWLDFVGPTTVLAYPMNFILFMILPSIAALIAKRWRRHSAARWNQANGTRSDS